MNNYLMLLLQRDVEKLDKGRQVVDYVIEDMKEHAHMVDASNKARDEQENEQYVKSD